jgi:hypothetical protein
MLDLTTELSMVEPSMVLRRAALSDLLLTLGNLSVWLLMVRLWDSMCTRTTQLEQFGQRDTVCK